jgi:hypothetical protein
MSVYPHREISPKLGIKLFFMSRKIAKQVEVMGETGGMNGFSACTLAATLENPVREDIPKG